MTHSEPLERRGHIGHVKGIGCCLPKEIKRYDQVVILYGRDIVGTRSAAKFNGTKADFFRGKELQVEQALREFVSKETRSDGKLYEVGYGLNKKYIYPGLPVEFAISIDPSIVEIIDIIAQSRHVAMTGSCCAGHPSQKVDNPYFYSSKLDASFAARTKGLHDSKPFLYSQNISPYMRVVFLKNGIGERIAEDIASICIKGPQNGKPGVSITSEIQQLYDGMFSGMLALGITAIPRLFSRKRNPEHEELTGIYQISLAAYWNAVKNAFEKAMGIRIRDVEPKDFEPRKAISYDDEFQLLQVRISNGRKLPNFEYFNGTEKLMEPVIS